MFGVNKRAFGKALTEMADIIGLHHQNVSTLQEALEHLGDAVQNMHELLKVQEARIELLEARTKLLDK
jgi:uncharacterized protein YukE